MAFVTDDTGEIFIVPDADALRRSSRWARRARAKIVAKTDELSQPNNKSVLSRLRYCGVPKNADVEIRWDGKKCFASGLLSCGSIWTCATCSARIRVRREADLELAAQRHCEWGGRLAMMTLTVRHKRDMPLTLSLEAILRSWDLLQRRTAFAGSETTPGLMTHADGFVRALEVTYGPNGWHPHLHVLMFIRPGVTPSQAQASTLALHEAWQELVTKELGLSPSIERGINFMWFGDDSKTAATYVTKIAKEITFADSKSGLDPMSLLDDTSPKSTAMFIEFANAMYRKKAMSWSQGLRQWLLLNLEQTDEELADDNDQIGECVGVISAAHWRTLTWREQVGWIEFYEQHRIYNTT